MQSTKFILSIISFILILSSCKEPKTLYELSPISETGNHHAVIQIPAGTVDLYEYDTKAGVFKVENINGRPVAVPYLPFPVNYGFLPSTYENLAKKDRENPINVFVVAPSFSKTTLINIIPLASAVFSDPSGKTVTVPIVAPADEQFRSLDVDDFAGFNRFPEAMSSIESFYRYWKIDQNLRFDGWKDSKWTSDFIKEHTDYSKVNYRDKENTSE